MKRSIAYHKVSLVPYILVFFLVISSNISSAQDATVYVSPFDMGKTLSNLYFSIDKNGFDYITTLKKKATPSGSDQYDGRIQVVTFETSESSKIIACEPTASLEFPLKIIVWEEENDIYLAYINPVFYKRRYFIQGCDEAISELNKSLIRVVNDAIRSQ